MTDLLAGLPSPSLGQAGTTLTVKRFAVPVAELPGAPSKMELPKGAQILKVIGQSTPDAGDALFMWALVDPYQEATERRTVITAGTGHLLDSKTFKSITWDFADTVSAMGGRMLIHVFISAPSALVLA